MAVQNKPASYQVIGYDGAGNIRRLLKKIEPKLYAFYSFLFGTGLIFLVVHNPQVNPVLLVPSVGMYAIAASLPFVLANKKLRVKRPVNMGEFVPMLVVVLTVCFSMWRYGVAMQLLNNLTVFGIYPQFAPFFYVLIALGIWFIVRKLQCLEYPMAVLAITASVGSVALAFATGLKNGSWIALGDYDVIAPVIVLGVLLSPKSWRWWLTAVGITGLFFSGSEQGALVALFIFLVVLVRRDWSRKLLLPVAALAICFAVSIPTGVFHNLYVENGRQGTLFERESAVEKLINHQGNIAELDYLVTGNRWNGNWKIRPITLTGYGLEINKLTQTTPHNQFLIMTDQVGLIAAIAWVAASLVWAKRTHNWYLFTVLAVIGLVDHFFWTKGHLWWYAVLGVESKGLIFRGGVVSPAPIVT